MTEDELREENKRLVVQIEEYKTRCDGLLQMVDKYKALWHGLCAEVIESLESMQPGNNKQA